MNLPPEIIIQYGIAIIALWMMYDMNHNHLVDIRDLLVEIKDILSKSN